jgi:hypothetical protein
MADRPKYRVEREVYQSRMRVADDADAVKYHAVSALALVGLLLGTLALIAIALQAAWVLALAGVVVNVLALRRIGAADGTLAGRNAALVGLFLSVAISVSVPVDWLLYRRLMRDEATQFAGLWFDFLRSNQPQKAHELTVDPSKRVRLDDHAWEEYREEMDARPAIERWLRQPEVRALLALGDKATIRLYETDSQWFEGNADRVVQTYAVTYPDSEGLKTFFVGLLLVRQMDIHTHRSFWTVNRTAGGVRPRSLGGDVFPTG